MNRIEALLSGQKQGFLASCMLAFLWIASKPYGAAMALRNWAYDRRWLKVHRVDVPVISIGNLTVGGTGKTPAVMWIAKWFRAQDVRVSIISRGYKAGEDGTNDEAKEMESRLPDVPHLQNPNRVAAAHVACDELETQLILLDDGFQHRRLDRDLNIVLIDATSPFGYGQLLPRGLLREPIRSLNRVDVVMVTRTDQVEPQRLADIRTQVQRYSPKAAWVEAVHRPLQLRNSLGELRDVSWLQNRRFFAFCGLGNPQGFLETIRHLGGEIVESYLFPDHHAFSAYEVQMLQESCQRIPNLDGAICTGKDLAKLEVPSLGVTPLWSLDVELQVRQGLEPLEDRLKALLPS